MLWAGSFIVLAMGLAVTCASAANSEGLDELVELNVAATGGRKAIEATQTVEYRIGIVEAGFAVTAIYVADRKGRMRIDVYDKGLRVFTEAFDGRDARQWTPAKGAHASSEAGKAALWHGIQSPGKLLGLHELEARGHHLERLDDESIDGRRHAVIRLTWSDGDATLLYLDAITHLITRGRDVRALHPDLDPATKWLENVHEDFRIQGGVMRPWTSRQVDLKTNAVLQTTRVTSLRVNAPLADAMFHFGAAPAQLSSEPAVQDR